VPFLTEFVLGNTSLDVRAAVDERLTRIYAREIDRLVGLGRLLTGDPAAGEDLAHEVFLRAVRASDGDPEHLRDPAWPWLRVTMTRLAMQRRRRLWREAVHLARISRRPLEQSSSEGTVDFLAALSTLPPRMRACAVLFYVEDLSTAQVARTMGCSGSTVENQLREARVRLARLLAIDERISEVR